MTLTTLATVLILCTGTKTFSDWKSHVSLPFHINPARVEWCLGGLCQPLGSYGPDAIELKTRSTDDERETAVIWPKEDKLDWIYVSRNKPSQSYRIQASCRIAR